MFYCARETMDFLGTYDDALDAMIESANLLTNIDSKQAKKDLEELRMALLLNTMPLKELALENKGEDLRYHTSKLQHLGRFWECEESIEGKEKETEVQND